MLQAHRYFYNTLKGCLVWKERLGAIVTLPHASSSEAELSSHEGWHSESAVARKSGGFIAVYGLLERCTQLIESKIVEAEGQPMSILQRRKQRPRRLSRPTQGHKLLPCEI